MIAGLGLIAPLVADSDFEVGIVIMEMAIYLLIALGCLRCLSVFHAHEFEAADHVQDAIHRELIIRAELCRDPLHHSCVRVAAASLFLDVGESGMKLCPAEGPPRN